MSLEYWFPLTSDLHNQGIASLANASVQSGCSLSSDGKLGGCYKNTGTMNTVATPISFSADQFTLCAWVRIDARTNGWNRAIGLSGSGTYMGMVCEHTNGQSVGFHYYKTINGTNTSIFDNYPCSPTVGAWYHYAMCYDGTRYYVYLNGNKIIDAVANKPNIRAEMTTLWLFGGTNNNYVKDSINDVRIYSHCLSALEIAEIAKGMILHYPLNNNGGGQPNLYNFESVASLWSASGLTLVDATDDVYGNVLKITSPSSVSSKRIYRGVRNVWKADTNFTVSFLAKASKTVVVKIERSRIDYAPDVTVGTTWKRYSTVISCTGTTTGGALGIQTSTAGADIYITQIKVELGDKATAYCPGVGDSHYIPMGYDSTTEYDVSGYGNNGMKNETITYLTDTPRYNVSTKIDSTSSYIQISNLTTTGFSNSYSFAWWGKVPTYSNKMMWGFSNGMRLNGIYNGNLWNTGDGANNPLYIPGTTTQVTVPTVNVWHHWVMTGDGTACKVYQDGVLWATAKTYKSISGTTIYINGWSSNTDYSYDNYQISDFRIYTTALSAAQVAELYNTAVSIANNGTLMGYELVEV